MMRLVMWLYPAAWRARYGDELEALIQDSPRTWRSWVDLAAGGFHMRLKAIPLVSLVFGLVAAGGVIGLTCSYMATPVWRATAVLQITPARVRENSPRVDLAPVVLQILRGVPDKELAVTIAPAGTKRGAQNFELKADDSDGSRAVARLKAAIDQALVGVPPGFYLDVLDWPHTGRKPVFPGRASFAVAGASGGLILALGSLLFRRSQGMSRGLQAA